MSFLSYTYDVRWLPSKCQLLKKQNEKHRGKRQQPLSFKRPMHFSVYPVFCKVFTGPQGCTTFSAHESMKSLKSSETENNRKTELWDFHSTVSICKINFPVRCGCCSCCASFKSRFPGDFLSVWATPSLPSLSSISQWSVIKGRGGGGGGEQPPNNSSESLCWEAQLSQIIQLWKLYLLSQCWNLVHPLPAWIAMKKLSMVMYSWGKTVRFSYFQHAYRLVHGCFGQSFDSRWPTWQTLAQLLVRVMAKNSH